MRSGSDSAVGTGAFDVERLGAALAEFAPEWIAFTGKNSARGALGPRVQFGRQPERLGPSRVFVLPSPSRAARGFWDVEYWHELARILDQSARPA